MPLLNYTTSVAHARSIAQITDQLVRHDAAEVTIVYAQQEPVGLRFVLPGVQRQVYLLRVDLDAIQAILARIARNRSNRDHTTRVAWRILKDWVDVQMALVEAGQARLDQILLPFIELSPGLTVYDAYLQRKLALSGPGRVR